MLQNEPENQQSATPASQIRVSAEELTAAINALEDESARKLEGTVPIGQVVQELNLSATSEEIWAQVQKQRRATAQAAAEEAAAAQAAADREAREKAAAEKAAARAAQTNDSPRWGHNRQWYWEENRQWQWNGPPRRRRGRFWALFGIAWALFGVTHGHLPHPVAAGTIVISGDNKTQTWNSGVDGVNVEIDGDNCRITLHGKPRSVSVNGDNDTVITDQADHVTTSGSNDAVQSGGGPSSKAIEYGDGDTALRHS